MKDRRDRVHLDLQQAPELPAHPSSHGIMLTGARRPDPTHEMRGARHRTRQLLHELERGADISILDRLD